jgi:hypothetical protein
MMTSTPTSPIPFKITRPRENDTGSVRRTVGHSIRCPRCGERRVLRSPALARTWLYGHHCTEVAE